MNLEQLIKICKLLNHERVKYVVVGGWAVYIHGYERATKDVDIIVDPSLQNISKLKQAFKDILPEAVAEMADSDVNDNVVVRMSGEGILVDVVARISDIDYEKAIKSAMIEEILGVKIPVADLDTMLELKSGVRDTDKRDYLFLKGKKEYLDKNKG